MFCAQPEVKNDCRKWRFVVLFRPEIAHEIVFKARIC